ncbi:Rieske 2Fe-2S domain-containing protein [Candidatus Uhrbacteria bacterium]|nr:Rieske 2Fe-2S domain-containing protein [Candidatus Uhrbacteria bacterium]
MRFFLAHRIPITVVAALTFLFVAAIYPTVTATLPWSIVGLCVLFALYAGAVRAWFDVGLSLLTGAVFAVARLLFSGPDPSTITLRAASLLALFLIHVVLLIGPWSRFIPKIRTWYKHRRHLGVTVFLLGLLHASIVLNLYYGLNILLAWQSAFTFFGSTALLVMAVLAATSWDWMQKHVSWRQWQFIHAAVLGVFLIEIWIATGIWKTSGDFPSWAGPALALFVAFWVVVAPWGLAPKLFKVVNGWKQLHVLIYIAYVSIILHVYFGAAEAQGAWAQWTLLGLLAFVTGSHAAGWIRNWQEKKKYAIPDNSGSRITSGMTKDWHDACAVSELKEGEGRRVDIHGLPVALFLHEGKPLAYFGFCSHQKGPLWQGKIVNGYLECPWHGWQFSVTDGSGPPGFHDRVPFYETNVENGRVWVNIQKGAGCRGYSCVGCSCKA